MQTMPMAAPGTQPGSHRAGDVPRLAQWIAAVPALGILLAQLLDWAVAHITAPWPLWAAVGALTVGLLANPIARLGAGRPPAVWVLPAAMFAGLLLLTFGLADLHRPSLLPRLVAVLLALGLLAGPLGAGRIRSRSPHDIVLAAAALAAVVVFAWPLAVDGVGYGTRSQYSAVDDLHYGTVRIVLMLLGVVIVATTVTGAVVVRQLTAVGAAFAALIVLLSALLSSNPLFFWPEYPYEWAAGFLSFGLVAALLPSLSWWADDSDIGAPRTALLSRWSGQPAVPVAELAQPLAAAVSLCLMVIVCVDWRAPYLSPTWPLVSSAALLAAALCADPLARVLLRRPAPAFVQSALMCLALLLVALGSADPHPPLAVLMVVAGLLGLGLIAGPEGRRLLRVRSPEAVLPLAALATIAVFVWALSIDGYDFFTVSHVTVINDDIHAGTVRLVFGLASVTLVATALRRSALIGRLVGLGAAVTALVLLLVTLDSASPASFSPAYPYYWAAGFLSLGVVAELLTRFVGLPSAEVLAERVNELSRTRTGALDVQATELRRIERDLHDGAQVRLIALSMKLGRAEDIYRDDPETAALLREAREDATAAIRELRELARGIAPPVLANRGLDAAVRSVAQRSGIEVAVTGALTRRLLPAVETAAYFVVAESLANAAKHAAGARVEIALHERGGDLFAEITDFGPGGADPAGGGLTGLRQRVEALDGELHVTSPPGVGTHIEAVLPCGR